jgi:hypothetical protein
MDFPDHSAIHSGPILWSHNPITQVLWFRLFRFRSPLLTESHSFSFPQGTEMFHFPWFRPEALCIQTPVTRHYSGWVFPFGNLRINVCLPLPEAYRSLPRPSSPSDAKASTVRPYLLDQIIKIGRMYEYILSSLCEELYFIYSNLYANFKEQPCLHKEIGDFTSP